MNDRLVATTIVEELGRNGTLGLEALYKKVKKLHGDMGGQFFNKTLMAMETRLDSGGVHWEMPRGTDAELAALKASCEHLGKLRDEVIEMGTLPPLGEWSKVNPNL